jgi:hypothetical protein
VNEPSGIGELKPGKRTAMTRFQRTSFTISSPFPQRNALIPFRFGFWPTVCGTHHRSDPGALPFVSIPSTLS